MVTMIKEDFRTRTTRPRITHRPEIVRGRDTNNSAIRNTCNLLPKVSRIFIRGMHRDQELVFVQTELFRDEIPCQFDGLILEVITKREITEHLKKCVMARCMAHILEVIMLSRLHARTFVTSRPGCMGVLRYP